MAKKKKSNKFLAEFLFWLHTVIIIFILISGLLMALPWVVLILVLVKLQQIVFHGCLITNFEIREGGIKKGQVYFQLAAKRFTGLRVGRTGVHIISTSVTVIALVVSVWASLAGYRLHL